ncbi:MAG: glycoside hydrolase family 99-like domain-containing protein [Bacteroidales bacterium]|nr:glycoside hydrolase family 99-like domain-containing protein [Bacteroidales bacterium]
MKRICILLSLALALILAASCGSPVSKGNDYIVAAYIWPSCHDDSLAHAHLWRDGIGEWEVIKKGDPRFEGHYQPRQPLLGYGLDDDPAVVEKWIDLALSHGVNTFVYDWYWFMDYPYLEGALNDGFLKASNNRRMNFYLMWANHYVKKNYWNYHLWGDDESILFDPVVTPAQFHKIVDRVINRYFKQPNYLKINGCPVFSIFSVENFIKCFDTPEEAAAAVQYFRDECVKAGFKGLHLQGNHGGAPSLTQPGELEKELGEIKLLGLNSEAHYNMGGFDCDYLTHCAKAERNRNNWEEKIAGPLNLPVFPTVSIGWDDTPRFPAKGAQHCTRFHQTPEVFRNYLQKAKAYADAHADRQPRIVLINAWNEWVEGSYLLPDNLYGYGYLNAVRDVFGPAK